MTELFDFGRLIIGLLIMVAAVLILAWGDVEDSIFQGFVLIALGILVLK